MEITQSISGSYDETRNRPDQADLIIDQVQGAEASPYVQPGELIKLEPCDSIRGGGGEYFVEVDGHKMLYTVQRKAGKRLRLVPRNDDFEDILIREGEDGVAGEGRSVDFRVIGRYAGPVDSWQRADR
jgi:phage repressor protein C with HTH and peptisase S24 domain